MILPTITGPTACGKTALAVALARRLNGEVISADSRQVFRGMDIGTGKDLADYGTGADAVPYHLIDIRQPGEEYNVYQFQQDFVAAYNAIVQRGHQPILCGGTGLYIDSLVRDYQLSDAPIDEEFRKSVADIPDEVLINRLKQYIKLHNHTDTETRERLVRALEIQEFRAHHPESYLHLPEMRHLVVAVRYPREVVVERIGIRLRQRLSGGMVEEVRRLLDDGVPSERLLRYGLEYKHVTRYLLGEETYDEMYEQLYTDIRRFSKRQMTWLRHVEREGTLIHWLDGALSLEEKVDSVLGLMKSMKE